MPPNFLVDPNCLETMNKHSGIPIEFVGRV